MKNSVSWSVRLSNLIDSPLNSEYTEQLKKYFAGTGYYLRITPLLTKNTKYIYMYLYTYLDIYRDI